MKQQIPYNAGDYVQRVIPTYGKLPQPGNKYIVMGHVWWPIERTNAYYMLRVNDYGEPVASAAEYLWDDKADYPSKFQYFTPKDA